jgi:hypothetical protein
VVCAIVGSGGGAMLDASGNLCTFWSQIDVMPSPAGRFRYQKPFAHSQTTTALSVPLNKSIHLFTLPGLDAASNLVHLSTLPCPSPSLRCNMAMQVAPQPFTAATQPEPDIMDIDIDMDVDLEPLDGDYDLEVLGLSLH